MNTTVTLDKAGRVLIPKALRDELRIEAGDTLELEAEGERLTLRPARSTTRLRKDRGVWVFRSGKKITAATTDKVQQDFREQRGREIRGKMLQKAWRLLRGTFFGGSVRHFDGHAGKRSSQSDEAIFSATSATGSALSP